MGTIHPRWASSTTGEGLKGGSNDRMGSAYTSVETYLRVSLEKFTKWPRIIHIWLAAHPGPLACPYTTNVEGFRPDSARPNRHPHPLSRPLWDRDSTLATFEVNTGNTSSKGSPSSINCCSACNNVNGRPMFRSIDHHHQSSAASPSEEQVNRSIERPAARHFAMVKAINVSCLEMR